jgi:hypothetical protein
MSDQELVDLLGVIKELRDERSLPEPYQPRSREILKCQVHRAAAVTVELDRDSLKQANDDACHDRAKDDEFGLKRHCNLPCLVLRSGPRRYPETASGSSPVYWSDGASRLGSKSLPSSKLGLMP